MDSSKTINSVKLKETNKVESQCVCDEETETTARQTSYPREMGAILPLAAERQICRARF